MQLTNQRPGRSPVLWDTGSKLDSDWLKSETITNDRGRWRTTLVDLNLKTCQTHMVQMVLSVSSMYLTLSFLGNFNNKQAQMNHKLHKLSNVCIT